MKDNLSIFVNDFYLIKKINSFLPIRMTKVYFSI